VPVGAPYEMGLIRLRRINSAKIPTLRDPVVQVLLLPFYGIRLYGNLFIIKVAEMPKFAVE